GFAPPLSTAEYFDLLRTAEPSLYARGDLIYVESNSFALRTQVSEIQTGDSRSDLLQVNETARQPYFAANALIVTGVTADDVISWPSVTSEEVRRRTVLGNRHSPPVSLRLRHTGPDRLVEAGWEGQLFVEACNRKNALVLKPPWVGSVPLRRNCYI